MSMELRSDIADRAESRLRSRSSGGRFSGWVLESIFFLREEEDPRSDECLAKVREFRGFDSRKDGDAGRGDLCEDDLVGDFDGALTGEAGSEDGGGGCCGCCCCCCCLCWYSSSSSSAARGFLDVFLEKNFIESSDSSACLNAPLFFGSKIER